MKITKELALFWDFANLPNFVQRRWPDVYRLPMEKIEMDILMVLDQGFCPQERRLTRFLDAIYEDATRYTFYPQGIHYEEMANAILDKWPHLVTEKPGMTMAEAKVLWKRRHHGKIDCVGNFKILGTDDVVKFPAVVQEMHEVRKTLWRKRILHKFQNSRRRRDSNNAVVQQYKRKSKSYIFITIQNSPTHLTENSHLNFHHQHLSLEATWFDILFMMFLINEFDQKIQIKCIGILTT
ncbi:hypothetical protein KUTeg_023135 [Tegillarca granosa]|uniref:Uncharacterized protein n=1 Tax=Tegillarca granosa TaxID=220873 RepID=A0ABQ9E1S0_TEGGR|nr:hypothetical protein KUTeg_023135 [Tegillarca granosa]